MALAYTAPTWVNGSGTGISASQLQALSDCMEGLVQGSDKAITDISMENSIITLTFADGSEETATATGLKGISSIAKTGTVGNVDTYTITYTDGTSTTFTVTNGVTPEITITATADGQSLDNPTVTVTKTGTDAEPNFAMAFSGLKGRKGDDNNISLSVMRIGTTSDPQFILKGNFYINGVLATTQAYYEIKIIDEQGIEIPLASSGTFTGDFSTVLAGSGWIPLTSIDGDTIQAYIYQDNTKAKLLACQSLVVGNKGEAGTGDMNSSVYDPDDDVANAGGIPAYIEDTIVANPQGTSVGALTSIGINGSKYDIQGGDPNAYSVNDTVSDVDFADTDKMPFYDASASGKKNSTWGNFKGNVRGAIGEEMTLAQYEALSQAEKNDGKIRFITDVDGRDSWELAETVTLSNCTSGSFFKLYKRGNELCAKYKITLSSGLPAGNNKNIGVISDASLRPKDDTVFFFLQNMNGAKMYMGAMLGITSAGNVNVYITQDYTGSATVLYNSGQSFYITE